MKGEEGRPKLKWPIHLCSQKRARSGISLSYQYLYADVRQLELHRVMRSIINTRPFHESADPVMRWEKHVNRF